MALGSCCQSYATFCRVLTNVWLIVGVIFSCLTLTTCEFLVRGDAVSWGLFQYGLGEGCTGSYEDGFTHGWLHTWAAVCGVLAPIFGGVVLIFMTLDCCTRVCCSRAMQSTLLSFAELSQACTFLLYASDACLTKTNETDSARDAFVYENATWADCKVGNGSVYSMIAFACFFLGGCWLCFSPKHDPIFCQKDEDAAEKSKKEDEEKPEQAVAQDEENAGGAEEVKPQVY